ncbi:hypothetical protein D3C79_840030 [compost metagenome]
MNRHVVHSCTLVALLLTGCALPLQERDMNAMASSLTKVSAAVDATVRYKRSADSLEGDALLQAATAHDPQMLKPLEGRTVKVLRAQRDSAVLVCDAPNALPLLEDAGCTARLDVHRWRQNLNDRCEFSLDLPQTCSR